MVHSLAMVLVWAVIVGLIYRLARRDNRGAVVVGALVVSHWVLDWITHIPDLALIGFMGVVYGASIASPPPPSVNALAWGALAAWLFPLWGAWVDKHRDRVALHARAVP